LQLLRRLDTACRRSRSLVLAHLHAGRAGDALQAAQQLSLLCRDESTDRLLAVCHLLCGQPEQALRIAGRLMS